MERNKLLGLSIAVSVFLGALLLMLAMVGPARLLPGYSVQAQEVHAQAVTTGSVFTRTVSTGTFITVNVTIGSGVNRLLLVGVGSQAFTQSPEREITSVKFGYSDGELALTNVISQEVGPGKLSAIYQLLDPPSGASGTVTVTYNQSVSYGIVVGAANLEGVDQTTPIAAAASAGMTDTLATVTVNTTPGDLVFDTVGLYMAPPVMPITPTVGQTQLWNERWGTSTVRVRSGASTKLADSATTTMSWDMPGSRSWAICAVAIKPAATGPTHQLTVAVDPVGGGTTNPAVGVHTYAENAVVDVSATPAEHYEFDHWEGACTGNGTCQVTMDADKSVTAFFTAIPQYVLTVNTSGPGSVTLNPPGGTYYRDTVVTLTPVPGACATFSSWSGPDSGDIQGSGPYTIAMNGNKTVQANFTALPQFTLTASNDGNGSVTLNPAGGTYCTGTTVTLTPVANGGYAFDGWGGPDSGDIVDTAGVYTIVMDADKSVKAFFYVPPWPTLDGAVSSGTGAPTASSVSFSHTTGTGTDRLMLVGVSWNCGSTNTTITSVTFTPDGGSALSLAEVWTEQYNWSTNYRYTAIYSLLNPPSGAAGTVNIAFSGAVSNGIIAGAANFAGVNQTNPLGTPGGAFGTGNNTSGTPNPAVTLTGLNGNELVFDSVFIGASSTSHALTPDAGQTALWNVLGYSSSSTSFNALGAASTKPATGASATMSWTTVNFGSTTTRWAIAAVPINPVAAGTGTIRVEKQTTPPGEEMGSFTFTGAASGTIADNGMLVVSDLPPGDYYVQEVVPAGWLLTNIVCNDDNSVGDLPNFEAEFHLTAGEDIQCTFYNVLDLDFGDAPDSYKTLLASDGARHTTASMFLGNGRDGESNGQPSTLADGDDLNVTDDEDGVTLAASYAPGDTAASVTVLTYYSNVLLDAWIDFNDNGVFDNPAEHLWGGTSQALTAGSPVQLTFAVPADAVAGTTYARFRSSNTGGLLPFGLAAYGEVEDYQVTIQAGPTCYALTLGHNGSGATPVAAPANSAGCAAGQYTAGENINLSGAAATTGWGIASWYGTGNDTAKTSTNSLVMPAGAHAAGVNYLRLLGDVNLDGAVNSTDALIILTVDAGLPAPAFCPMNYGDVNGDGYTNSTDALIILTYDVGMTVPFPVGQPAVEPVITQPPGCVGG